MDMRLQLVPLRCTDVDRARAFYVERVGFGLDHDVEPAEGIRVVQLTPPGSACSVMVGTGLGVGGPDADPVVGLHLVVADVDAARAALRERGVDVSEVEDMGGGIRYAHFRDPDGNSWALQQIG